MTAEESASRRPGAPAAAPSALEQLRRWEAAGGGWHVVALGPTGGTVLLDRCDLGESVDSLSSADADFLAHLQARRDGRG